MNITVSAFVEAYLGPYQITSQQAFTCSNSPMEMLEKGLKYAQS